MKSLRKIAQETLDEGIVAEPIPLAEKYFDAVTGGCRVVGHRKFTKHAGQPGPGALNSAYWQDIKTFDCTAQPPPGPQD